VIDLGLEGKRVVVSGAGYLPTRAGHGRHTTLQFARAGARLACIDIDQGRAEAVVAEARAEGAEAHAIVADMTDGGEVERAMAEAVDALGGIDVGIDIIGRATWNRVEDVTAEEWSAAIDVNLTQVFRLFQAASKQMIRQGSGGALVALASVDGTVAAAYHAPYGAAKAGVIHLAKTFAYELGRHGIRVNVVAPGNVGGGNDDQPDNVWAVDETNPLVAPRAIDIANAALFLSSSLAARITGQTIIVDGGATIRQAWSITPETLHLFRDDD
jgi:3-oxoacyl-[acyl-carrier protein] reductase